MEKKRLYVKVSVGVDANWQQSVFTYTTPLDVTIGAVVIVPFGNKQKLGIVRAAASKPPFSAKSIIHDTGIVLPLQILQQLEWLESYYPFSNGVLVQHLLPSFLYKSNDNNGRTETDKTQLKPLPPLTNAQSEALRSITKTNKAILHGITGSGKTRVYMEVIAKAIRSNKNVLLLYPEISLTAQIQSTLQTHFGVDKIHVYHSKLASTAQKNAWFSALKATKGNIFIGPRSALFLPLSNLSAVIVDEAHDGSYKQDSGIRYNGLLVAASLAKIHKAKFIIGSATPPIQETYQLLAKGAELICMHETATTTAPTDKDFKLVAMNDSSHKSRIPLISKVLLQEIELSLKKHKQSLLFLNKRGTARILLCEQCGWHAYCPDCMLPLTYHHDNYVMRCHICGYKGTVPLTCPDNGHQLTQQRLGVKAVESELRNKFPDATIKRFDSDNKKSESFTSVYDSIADGSVDIILGTQLITKGIDLPQLTTVGILSADSSLMLPDYTSEERAFQQLAQVSGRVGRGHGASRIVIQTYQEKNPLFKLVMEEDWHEFYHQEVHKRKQTNYPPFSYTLKIWVARRTDTSAQKAIQNIKDQLSVVNGIQILGPAPAFYEKIGRDYRWQLVITSASRKRLLDIIKSLPGGTHFDIDPVSLL